MEFHSAGQKFTAGLVTTDSELEMKFPPGSHGNSPRSVVESPDPMMNDQYSGKIADRNTTRRIEYAQKPGREPRMRMALAPRRRCGVCGMASSMIARGGGVPMLIVRPPSGRSWRFGRARGAAAWTARI